MSSSNPPIIEPNIFYKSAVLPSKFANVELSRLPFDIVLPRWLRSLQGPSPLWKVFKKQSDALQFSKNHGEGLMTYAFQEWDGTRRFLSAHPVLFWFYDDNHKKPEERRSYEVITEGAICKLYFDLEFQKECNPIHDGVQMTNNFIKIVSFFLKKEFGVICNRSLVLDLDSTTNLKFSRHLVFQLPRTYFRDNYNVGNFVKMICDTLRLVACSPVALQDLCSSTDVSEAETQNLFVSDQHGVKKLFCDEAVYTKNRHFRMYKSTKWKKNSPLLISHENEYKPLQTAEEELSEKELFLDSLITYVDNTCSDITILEYGHQEQRKYQVKSSSKLPECRVVSEAGNVSPLPILDRFVLKTISPGSIRRSIYSLELKFLTYEISGNRFCHNIGRPHKSNNVYYVVDLQNSVYYQKCHDPDCSGYRSKEERLPPEVVFFLENEGDASFESVALLSDEELQEVWQAVSSVVGLEHTEPEMENSISEHFPEFGMCDSELLNSSKLVEEKF